MSIASGVVLFAPPQVGAITLALLFGLLPAWQATRVDPIGAMKDQMGASAGRSRLTLNKSLVVTQVALSMFLLVGAGLFVRSLSHVRVIPLGYDVDPVLLVELNMRGVRLDSARNVQLRQELLETAQATPGVERASRQVTVPFWGSWNVTLYVAGIDSVDRLGEFYLNAVTPDYFATLGTRVLRGRGIAAQDAEHAPRVMVVSDAMAKTLWPGRDPIGQCVKLGADTAPCTYVVGVTTPACSTISRRRSGILKTVVCSSGRAGTRRVRSRRSVAACSRSCPVPRTSPSHRCATSWASRRDPGSWARPCSSPSVPLPSRWPRSVCTA